MSTAKTNSSALAVKTILSTAIFALPFGFAPTAAQAEDIKSQVPAGQIADYCRTAGVGSEETTTFMLPDMKRVTGTVRCEAQDLLVAADSTPANYADDDDDDSDRDADHRGDDSEDDDDDD